MADARITIDTAIRTVRPPGKPEFQLSSPRIRIFDDVKNNDGMTLEAYSDMVLANGRWVTLNKSFGEQPAREGKCIGASIIIRDVLEISEQLGNRADDEEKLALEQFSGLSDGAKEKLDGRVYDLSEEQIKAFDLVARNSTSNLRHLELKRQEENERKKRKKLQEQIAQVRNKKTVNS